MTKRLTDKEKGERKAARAGLKTTTKEKAQRDLAAAKKPTPSAEIRALAARISGEQKPPASTQQASLPGTQSPRHGRVEKLAQKWLAADDERKIQAAMAEEMNRQLVIAMDDAGLDTYHRGGVHVVLPDATHKAKVKRIKDDAGE